MIIEILGDSFLRFRERLRHHEISAQGYLNSLSEQDRIHVQNLIGFLSSLKVADEFEGVRLGLVAFGSTTRPSFLRDHSPDDIDLCVLHSVEPKLGALDDKQIRDSLVNEFVAYLETQETQISYRVAGDIPDITFFEMKYSDGLSLHVIFPRWRRHDLESSLEIRRKENIYFSLLF